MADTTSIKALGLDEEAVSKLVRDLGTMFVEEAFKREIPAPIFAFCLARTLGFVLGAISKLTPEVGPTFLPFMHEVIAEAYETSQEAAKEWASWGISGHAKAFEVWRTLL